MSIFVQVDSEEKGCPIIINLDHVMEIAPLTSGGCMIRFLYDGGNVAREIIVKNKYTEFKQFVLETVTTEHISKKVEELQKLQKKTGPKESIPLKADETDIPKFGD